eukprot:3774558-Pleurochrysis_carterae.AAC.1
MPANLRIPAILQTPANLRVPAILRTPAIVRIRAATYRAHRAFSSRKSTRLHYRPYSHVRQGTNGPSAAFTMKRSSNRSESSSR